jgi:hypothetical protein
MIEKKEDKEPKRRTQVRDLPPEEKELTKDEQKKIKGGEAGDFYTYNGRRTTGN